MLHPSWIEDLLEDESKQSPSATSSESDSPSSSSSSLLWSEPHTTMPFAAAPTPSPQDLWAVANALQTATLQTAALQKIAQLLSSATLLSSSGWAPDASVTAHQLATSPPGSAGLALPRDDVAAVLGSKPVASWMVDKNTLEAYLQQYAAHLVGILDEGHKTELMRGGTAVTVFLVMHLLRHMEPQGWVSKNVAHPAKYLTTSIKNLRAALCSNPLVSTLLTSIWELRPDIAMWVDGKTLHYIADHLASEHVAVECLACLADALPVGWSISMPNQRATVLSTVKHFFAVKYHLGNMKPQPMVPMVPFAQLA